MLWKEGCTNEIECSPWYGHMVEKGTTFFSASNEQLATKSCPRVAWELILVLHSYHLASSIPINSNPFQLARAYEKIPRDLWEFLRALLNSSIWERNYVPSVNLCHSLLSFSLTISMPREEIFQTLHVTFKWSFVEWLVLGIIEEQYHNSKRT